MRLFTKLTGLIMALIVLSLWPGAQAQIIDTLWTHTYWNGYFDSVDCLIETADGGFIMAGSTQEMGASEFDINLVKTDSAGVESWTKQIGDTTHEVAYHILQTFDGGYLISANSDAFGTGIGDYRLWILRTDDAGDTLWTYPLTGIDHNGYPLWAVQTADSGYAITGIVNISYDNKVFILRLDKDGNQVWFQTYGDYGHQDGRFIAEMPDSGFIVAGVFDNVYSTGYDWWVFRTDKSNTLLWDSTYILTDYYDELGGACMVDDGLVMVGEARAAGHVMKIDFDGNTLWSKSIAINPTNEDHNSVCTTTDGGFMVGGWLWVTGHRRDFCFTKLDSDGDTLWSYTVGGSEDDHGRSIVATSDGYAVMAGNSSSFFMGDCFYLARVGEVVTAVENGMIATLPNEFRLSANYPNPFNPTTSISYTIAHRAEVTLTIFNILGQEVRVLVDAPRAAGTYTVEWDGRDVRGSHQPSGVYFCQLKAGDFNQTRKMVLAK